MGLLNALGGGAIVYGSMAHQENMAQLQQQLDIDRAQRIEEMKRNFAAADRATQAREINAGAEGMIDEKIGRRFASSDAAVADAQAGKTDMPMTQEQLDVIAQSKAGARDEVSDADKLRARIAAGEKAGYDMTKERTQLIQLADSEARAEDRKELARIRDEDRKDKHEYYMGKLAKDSGQGRKGNDPTLGRDKFDAKQWHDASKDLEKFVSYSDGSSEKPVLNKVAMSFVHGEMNAARNAGHNPYDASQAVSNKMMLLQERAEAAVKNNPKLSISDAMSNEIRAYQKARSAAMSGGRPDESSGESSSPAPSKSRAPGMIEKPQSEDLGFDPAKDFDIVFDAAKRGSGNHLRQLQAWIDGNDLPGSQAQKAKSLLK